MKINKKMYVAVNSYGEIAATQEGELVGDDKSELHFMLKAWGISRSEFLVKPAKIVLLDEE